MSYEDYSEKEIAFMVTEIMEFQDKLNEWELDFMNSIIESDYSKLSQKQRDVLIKLFEGVGENGY